MRFIAKMNSWPIDPLPKLTQEQKKTINNAFKKLLAEWKIALKIFPGASKLSSPFIHLNRYQLILLDLKNFLERKHLENSYDLEVIEFENNCPEYFKRNYHYQTDGYFSLESAARYDHQIELLFLGSAHIMRKVAFSILAPVLPKNAEVLEFGAGTGTSGFQFKQLFPNIELDLLEPSSPYLKYAKETYQGSFRDVIPDFIERFNSSKKYDCIFSCFVMHEIPVSHWQGVIYGIKNSLKENGHLLIVDSQQNCDRKEHQFALDQFAEDFYEPYFQEFREKSLIEYFESNGLKLVAEKEVLFSKSLLFRKDT